MSEAAPVYIHVVLAVVYLYGGLAKMRCPRLVAGTFATLGAPLPLAHALARALPGVEIVGGLLILATEGWPRRTVVAVLALVLLGGVVSAWRTRGQGVPCACLGPGDPSTLGAETWVRNGILLLASFGVAVSPGPSVLRVASESVSGATGLCLVTVATVLALYLHVNLNHQRSITDRLPGLLHSTQQATVHQALGAERVPRLIGNLHVHDAEGRANDLRTLSDQRAQFVIVTEPDCGACAAVLPHVEEMQERLRDVADVRALSLEPLCDHPKPGVMPAGTLFAADGRVARMWTTALLAQGTPALCVVQAGLVLSHDSLSELHDLDALAAELGES